MSQSDFGNLESPLSGTSFINTHLEPFRNALHTNHSGNARPTYAQAGMFWIDNSITEWNMNFFTGSADVAFARLNTTNQQVKLVNVREVRAATVDGIDIQNHLGLPMATLTNTTFTFEPDVVLNGTLTINGSSVNFGADSVTGIASQAQAEAGTSPDTIMTPERTAQAIATLSPPDPFVSSDITSQADTPIAATDEIVYADTSDSGNLKKDTVQGILDLVPEPTVGGGLIGYRVFTSSGTWVRPVDCNAVKVTVVGGGGGRGGFSTGAGVSGGTGGTSSFGSYCSASGGSGGIGNSNRQNFGGLGGVGSNGLLNLTGGDGGNGVRGGSDGQNSDEFGLGGNGGSSTHGGGGRGDTQIEQSGSSSDNYQDGNNYGGGGGGYVDTNGGAFLQGRVSGGGGGGGTSIDYITNPPSTVSVTVGAGGSVGSGGGLSTGRGAQGVVIVEEYS